MRIAFVSTMGGSKWGGSEELWSLTAAELLKQGHQVYISIFTGVSSERLLALQKGGAIIHRRKLAEGSASLQAKLFNKAKDILAQRFGWDYASLIAFKPEVLCFNLAGSYDILYSPELRALTNKLGIPFTIICQGHDDIPFTTEQFRQTVKAIFVKANWIAFVSQANLQSTQRHLAIKLPNGFVVNNPANLSSIDCVSYPQDNSTIKFAIVSRLDTRQKGHDILFEALSKPQWKIRNWSLTLAGSGIHHQYLLELVRLYGIEDNKTEVAKSKLFGKEILRTNKYWYAQCVLELFIDNVYYFKSENQSPIIVDCGVNIGLSLIYFKRLYPDSVIIGFEADPKIFELCSRNIKAFNYDKVNIINAAVWKEEGRISFTSDNSLGGKLENNGVGKSEHSITVDTISLLPYLDKKIDFLKMISKVQSTKF